MSGRDDVLQRKPPLRKKGALRLGPGTGDSFQRILSYGLLYLVLIIGAGIFLFPFLWMVLTSLKSLPDVYKFPPVWIPPQLMWGNYIEALTRFQPFGLFFKNTLIIVSWVILGDVLSCSFVAYGFARLRFPGRDALFLILISTMMVPFVVRLVPLFIIFRNLGWINTFLPLTVPHFFGTPFFIFLVRQFFMTVPKELEDAARIDGCSELGIWARIFLPLSKPVLAVVAIFAFQETWNDFLAPLIFLNDHTRKTVILGLYGMIGTGGAEQQWNLIMAAAVTMVVPLVLAFIVSQRYLTRGITVTGIKG